MKTLRNIILNLQSVADKIDVRDDESQDMFTKIHGIINELIENDMNGDEQ